MVLEYEYCHIFYYYISLLYYAWLSFISRKSKLKKFHFPIYVFSLVLLSNITKEILILFRIIWRVNHVFKNPNLILKCEGSLRLEVIRLLEILRYLIFLNFVPFSEMHFRFLS